MNRNKRKCRAQFTSSTHNKAFDNLTIEVRGYKLEITRTATVYWNSGKGKRKLDSIVLKYGLLSVSLPDDTEVEITNTPEGLKVKGKEEKIDTSEEVKVK